MTKLKLKRTPEEEAERQARKARKRAKRAQESLPYPYSPEHEKKLREELEEARFREKLYGAMEDDQGDEFMSRLDQLEAQLNDYAQIPDRWRMPGSSKRASRNYNDEEGDEWMRMDPRHMDDEEYAEWIRAGMYRKTHAEEYEERNRQKAAEAERKAREKAIKEETKRLEKEVREAKEKRRSERETRRWERAIEEYEQRWKSLLEETQEELVFADIPWPIKDTKGMRLEDLTLDCISTFLLRDLSNTTRKDKLRETMLRYHPDKFEGRILRRVKESEKEMVREAVGQVARALNELMGQ